MKNYREYTDLEVVYAYAEQCSAFIDPVLFCEIKVRGLYPIVNKLKGRTKEDRRANAYARLAQSGRMVPTNDDEIDRVQSLVNHIAKLQKELASIQPTEAEKIVEVVEKLRKGAQRLIDYYNEKVS